MNEIQKKELEILNEVMVVLKKHDLKFYAIGGTCIGAIRHKGFIPWDDDIDIALPRADYEKFRNEYYKELPEKYKKLDCDNSVSNDFLFMKIYDSETTYVETYAKKAPDRFTGVFVDIMPVDGLPDDDSQRARVTKEIDRLSHMNCLNRPWHGDTSSAAAKLKQAGKKLLQATHKYNYYSDKIRELGSEYDCRETKYTMFTWRYAIQIKRKYFKSELFEDVIEVPFEDSTIMIPARYDEYLTLDFGDYMKLPPIEKQQPVHNVYICDLEKPCSYYAELEKKKG